MGGHRYTSRGDPREGMGQAKCHRLSDAHSSFGAPLGLLMGGGQLLAVLEVHHRPAVPTAVLPQDWRCECAAGAAGLQCPTLQG